MQLSRYSGEIKLVSYKGMKIRLVSEFSSTIQYSRRQWSETVDVLRKESSQPVKAEKPSPQQVLMHLWKKFQWKKDKKYLTLKTVKKI